MAIPWLGYAIETASAALFAWCWLEPRGWRRGRTQELLTAVLCGWFLETRDLLTFGTPTTTNR